MKIFLTVSKSGQTKFGNTYQKVLKELETQGAKVEATFIKTYLNKSPKLKAIKDLADSEDSYRLSYRLVVDIAITILRIG